MKSSLTKFTLAGLFTCLALALTPTSRAQSSSQRQEPAQNRGSNPAQEVQVQQELQVNQLRQTNLQQQSGAITAKPRPAPVPATLDRVAEKLKIGTPRTHANLTIFPIEADDFADTTKVLTLAEAMGRKGTIVVKETGNVNELTVENKDAEHTVLIMAGDIVKGGKQDRTLGSDLPLTSKSGVVPISAFCVEQGRWSRRGGEDVSQFSASSNVVATKEGKLAVRRAKAQGEVWESVAKAQAKISGNIKAPVADAASPTSLQLSLENPALKKENEAFISALKDLAEASPKAIGYVCVINGHVNGAEIFAGHDLFRRAWPRMLEAAATEAIAEQKEKTAPTAATAKDAGEFLAKAEDAKAMKENIHAKYWSVSAEGEKTILFQTVDEENGNRWLRRSIIAK